MKLRLCRTTVGAAAQAGSSRLEGTFPQPVLLRPTPLAWGQSQWGSCLWV